VATPVIRSASARRRGRGLALAFRATAPVTVDLFRQSAGRRVLGERLVKRFSSVRGALRWNGRDRRGRRLGDGYYVARFTATSNGVREVRRIALSRRNGRFARVPAYDRRDRCGALRSFKLERPVFGGRSNRALNLAFRFAETTRAEIVVRRGSRVVKRFPAASYTGGRAHRKRISVTRRLPRGRYRVTLTVRDAGSRTSATLQAVRL
jgi:hypothetical protein